MILLCLNLLNNVFLIFQDKIRLWDESVKCLFLRARSPRGEVFDELITKIFKIKIHSNEAKSYLEKTRKFFIDFRNKFNQIILTSVEEFKEIRKNRYLFNCFVANQIVLFVLIINLIIEHLLEVYLKRNLQITLMKNLSKRF